jgi:hypothetical protein
MNDPEEREKIAPQPEWENNQNLEYAEYYLARNLVLMPVSELAKGVSDLLEEILRESENAEIDVTLFHVPVPPVITIAAFLERIAKYSRCCQETYILAFIYIDRYNKEKQSSLNHHNVHK